MHEGYDVAQVCPNGHVANDSVRNFPQANKAFCDKCGEKTMTDCPACQQAIRGSYWGSVGINRYHPPAYCIHCGGPFPWTERKIQAAIELFADEVTPEEVAGFEKDVRAVTQDTPAAQVASNRI